MRVNIRIKLFLMIGSTLFLSAAVFMGVSAITVKGLALRKFRNTMTAAYQEFKRDYSSDVDLP